MQGACAGGKESSLVQGFAWVDVPGAWRMLSVSPPRTLEEPSPLREQHFIGGETKAESMALPAHGPCSETVPTSYSCLTDIKGSC